MKEFFGKMGIFLGEKEEGIWFDWRENWVYSFLRDSE